MEPVIGIVIGLVVAAGLVALVHRSRTKGRPGPQPDGAQGAAGIPADPGAGRPAGPGAEEQGPAAGGSTEVGAAEEDRDRS
jgi:hypothetical protein